MSLGLVTLLRSEVSNLILKGQLGPRVVDVTFLHQRSPALSGTLRKPQNLPGCVLARRSCQAHCGYHRYLTKLGSALIVYLPVYTVHGRWVCSRMVGESHCLMARSTHSSGALQSAPAQWVDLLLWHSDSFTVWDSGSPCTVGRGQFP